MKFISPKLHGIIDYLVVAFLFASPGIFGMDSTLGMYTYALAAVHLILTLLTNFSAGVIKIIPLQWHGAVELVVGVALIAIAFTVLKNDAVGHLFYACLGVAVLAVFLCTDYRKAT